MLQRTLKSGIYIVILLFAACGGNEEPLPTVISELPTDTAAPTLGATPTQTLIPATATPAQATVVPPTEVASVEDTPPVVDDAACAALVQAAYEQTRTACQNIGDDQACYGNVSIEPEPDTLDFNEAGDIAQVADIQSLRLSSMDTEKQEWGISLMRLYAAETSQSVELLLFGNVELESAGSSDSGLQAYTFTSGANDRPCQAAPDSGILVQTPQGIGEITVLINEVVIDLGSTAYLQSQPGAEMSVNTLEGQATVTSNGTTVLASAGTRTRIPMDASGLASGAPSDPEPYTDSPLRPLPMTLLRQTVDISPPAVVVPRSRTLGQVTDALSFDGALDPTRRDIYFFRSDAGQLLYFYSLIPDAGCCFSWELFDPSGTSLFTGGVSTAADYHDVRTEAAGRYKLILEGLTDFTGSYEGQLGIAPEPQAFSIQLGDTIMPDAPSPGAGRIEAIGAQDIYTFSAEPGQRIYLEPLSDNGVNQIEWSLTDEDGTAIFRSRGFGSAFDELHTLERGGLYTLSIDGQQLFVGDYSFKLWDTPPAQGFSLTLDDPVTQDSIDTPGAENVYTFTTEPGQQIFIDAPEGGCCDFRWVVTDDAGDRVLNTSSVDDTDLLLEAGGAYTLTVSGRNDHIGSYNFQILSVPPPITFPITLDELVAPGSPAEGAGSIETPGAQDIYTFTAQAGQQIFIDAPEGGCCDFRWILMDDTGDRVLNTSSVDDTDLLLEAGGSYTFIVDGGGDHVGSYSFQILSVALPDTSTISLDGPVIQGNIEAPGAQDVYTFTAEPGQEIFIDVPEGGCCDFRWTLIDEAGERILNTSSADDSNLVLEVGGAYTLTVNGGGEFVGTYSFQILSVASSEAVVITLGGPVMGGSIESPGEQDSYTFTAEAGQHIIIVAPESGCCDFRWTITDGTGDRVLNTSSVDGTDLVLENGGAYTLMVDGNGDFVGTYSFQILGIAPSETSAITLDGPVTRGSIDEPGEQDSYTFTAEAGQHIFIDAPEGGCCDFYWILTDETGGQALYTSSADDNDLVLENGGVYTLVVDGIDNNTGAYGFQILNVVPPQTFEFPLGSVVTPDGSGAGSIETFATQDSYTFNVEQGQTVFITKLEEAVPSGLLYFSLLDEDGEFVFQDQYFNVQQVEPYTLMRGGQYVLQVYGYADTLGTYRLRIALDPFGVRPLDGDFVRQWASSATATSQYSDPNWSAMQATGEPNTFQCGDITTAWASESAQGMDTLELRYEQAVIPARIDIYQTLNPGSITGVQLITESGETITLPDTADPPDNTLCPGVFSFDVPDIPESVIGVIINLDQTIGGSWNEIDAVELIGTRVN